ncbi:putative secreted protein [Streptomyces sp. Tu6071]|uniref:N-acetylmuramoyl-L-alanine amidase n=1 Tax=Streptomyces sp. Tu6071 TaxID=355249 RepID=UPI00020E5768|nr:N-acetylmuramoyl-L-alanine amidase [Streptomyces sp. Tu6071]EGJ75255.1 putative secreted protein [Streptomyces sp. Tu6071]
MRTFLATSIGVTCAAVLTLPLAPAAAAHPDPRPHPRTAAPARTASASAPVPGSTASLPLTRLPATRADGHDRYGASLSRRTTKPFSLVGIVWDDPARTLTGTAEVRVRDARTGAWGAWQALETHNAEHAADPESREARAPGRHGGTAPLWTGAADAVEARVSGPAPLPAGLRIDLVDPGTDRRGTTRPAPGPVRPPAGHGALPRGQAPEPAIVDRAGWGADENLREPQFGYTGPVRAAFVHHSASGNNYTCAEAPSVIRGIYRYHVESNGWRDIGYNFLVDKCGTVYEGRAGGVAKPVMGAHTLGFNTDSTGVALLGTYTDTEPSAAALDGLAKLTAWKLGLNNMDPEGKVTLVSDGGNLYEKGAKVSLDVISGHRDGFATECPGKLLYEKLGTLRSKAAALQGR